MKWQDVLQLLHGMALFEASALLAGPDPPGEIRRQFSSYHGIIPESVPVVTSVTTNRPGRFETPLGDFLYRHLKRDLFWGYREVDVDAGQKAFVALPEKALLDHFYLTPGIIDSSFVRELRLAPEHLDCRRLDSFATRAAKPKLARAAALTIRILEQEKTGETSL